MATIYYIGDWAVMCGPVFAEAPFNNWGPPIDKLPKLCYNRLCKFTRLTNRDRFLVDEKSNEATD